MPPVPERAARRAEIARIRSSPTEEQRNELRYAADSHTMWTMLFEHRCEDQIASCNDIIPRRRLNADRRREWWGMPGRTLEVILDHIETGNTPCLEYPPRPSFSRRRGRSWTPR